MTASALTSGPLRWTEVEVAPVAPAITAQTLLARQLSTTRFELEPEAVIPRHAHPNDELGVVLRGALRLRCGDETFTVTAGESFFVAGGDEHDGFALDEGCTLLECYAPPRVPAPATEDVR